MRSPTVTSDRRSRFARLFEAAYRDIRLPSDYREFITSDGYLPYRQAVIRGLFGYDAEEVFIDLDNLVLLKRDRLFEESDIDLKSVREYHPIAIVHQSPQFLAIDSTSEAAPVFLWHHETGAFHPQFRTFSDFVKALRTPMQAREDRRRIRHAFANIRKECLPALRRAKRRFHAGDLDAAEAEIGAVLSGRRPIRYDGRNDFEAIGILCDCFNLRGRTLLARGRFDAARSAFLDAAGCGGTAYWEAAVNLIVTSLLLGDTPPASANVDELDASAFPEPPGSIIRRNFTESQIAQLQHATMNPRLGNRTRQLAARVLSWL